MEQTEADKAALKHLEPSVQPSVRSLSVADIFGPQAAVFQRSEDSDLITISITEGGSAVTFTIDQARELSKAFTALSI